MNKIIIIGGGAAGAKCASKSKRLHSENEVILFTNDSNIAVSLCGLPYFIEGAVLNIKNLIIKTPSDFESMGIKVYTNRVVDKIIPDRKVIISSNEEFSYDKLVIATGAGVFIPDVKNINANNIFTLRDLDSGLKIKQKAYTHSSVLLIGGGYIALELLEAFVKNSLKVILVEKNNQIMNDFDFDFSKIIMEEIKQKCGQNVDFYLSNQLVEILVDENNNFIGAKLKNENNEITEVKADFCVLATGAMPNIKLAQDAGIKIGKTGAIEVDSRMRTNIDDIYAIGDCAEKYSLITKQEKYIGLGSIANKEGRTAALNLTLHDLGAKFEGVLGSTITRFFDHAISKVGLSYKEALEYSKLVRINPIETIIIKNDKASYMPSVNKIYFKMVADKRTGAILGAQAFGIVGTIAQRVNTIACAIRSNLTVEEFLNLDLPYAPPFSSSIDPILTAGYKLKEMIDKR